MNDMKSYYIRISSWGTETPDIIDDKIMYQAEHGMNYLNPDDYDFLCEAECMRDAESFYDEELSDYIFTRFAESSHP